jgi:hypothetical protein
MKDIEEIKKTPGLFIKKEMKNGFGGILFPIEYKNGKIKVKNEYGKGLHFIFSWSCGYEHLSVSTPVRTPSWDEMCKMKEIFWKDDEVCMQLHPKKEDYVNNMKYCLHIWRPINEKIPTPPSIMVGFRPNKLKEDIQDLIKYTKEMGIEIDNEAMKEIESLGININNLNTEE